MSIINLKNDRLREYVKKVLGPSTYGEPFDTLLVEIFVREQYVLDLSPQELYEDLINFKNSVKEITFGNVENPKWSGVQYPGLKKIVLNFDYWQDIANRFPPEVYYEKLFETLAHESLHGMQSKNGINRAEGYNRIIGNRTHAIFEICTQGIAAKMTHNRSRNDFFYNNILTGDGYADEIFAVSLIAASFGVSDKDVLKYGVRERDKLVDVLNRNIGDINLTKNLLFQIETQLDYMHSVNYPDSNQTEYINLTYDQRKYNTTLAIKNLAELANEVLISRIQHAPLDFEMKTVLQLKNDHKKLKDILIYEFSHYGGELTENYSRFAIEMNASGNAQYIKEAINVYSEISQDETGQLKSNAPNLINAVKTGNFEYCIDCGISFLGDQNIDFSITDVNFNDQIAKNDFNDFKTWDNSVIYQALSNGMYFAPKKTMSKRVLNSWDNLYTEEGRRKIEDLRNVLWANKQKYGLESKDVLLEFLEAQDSEWLQKITRTNDARQTFLKSFNRISDQEFLAKLIADRYIDHTFDQNGNFIPQDTKREQEIQKYMFTTYKKQGKTGLINAISEMLINDDYNQFSGEIYGLNIAAFGKKNVFDVISQPLINELLNQRQIAPKKELAFRKAVFAIETKFPGTTNYRLAHIIEQKKNGKRLYSELIPREARVEFYQAFKTENGVEDLVGILCNEYSKNYRNSEENQGSAKNIYFNDVIQRYGEDFFREAMITGLVRGDFSSLENLGYGYYFSSTPTNELVSDLSTPYIEKTQLLGKIELWNLRNKYDKTFAISQLDSIAKKQNFSKFNNFLTGLFKNRSNSKNNDNQVLGG